MAKSRMGAVEEAGKDGKNKNIARYFWVDIDKLERFGIVGWTPRDSANFITIIPPIDDEIFYAREVYVHYNVGGEKGSTHLCPKETKDVKTKKKWNKPCAVCEKRHRLSAKDSTRESADELRPSRRFLFYIVDTSDLPEDATTKEMETAGKKVTWYDGSPTFRDCVTGASENKRKGGWIDVSDPDTGKTICFDREGKGKKTKYKNFALESRDPIPDKWLEVPDYDDILLIPDYDEVATEVDLASYDDSPDESSGSRSRSRRERVVDEDSPSEDKTPSRSRTRKLPKDESEKKEIEDDEHPKESEKEEDEVSSDDDEVNKIKQRIRDKKRSKE